MFDFSHTPVRRGGKSAENDRSNHSIADTPDGRNRGIGPTESLLAYAAAIGATFLARQALQQTWRKTFDREPPKNPASPEVDWQDALLWGAVSGALIGMVRIASRRASSSLYR